MSLLIQKHLPINQTMNQEIGKPSRDQEYNKTLEEYIKNKTSKTNSSKQSYANLNNQELQNKVNQFINSKNPTQNPQFSQYHDQFCVCSDCTYERNLSKPSHTLFNLTMRSIYNQSYTNNFHQHSKNNIQKRSNSNFKKLYQLPIYNDTASNINQGNIGKSVNQKQSSIYPKKKVTLNTIYNIEMSYQHPKQRTKLIRNQDSLKFQGPFQQITIYKQKFPGVSGDNPYVKPIQKALRESFKLDAKTMNQAFYKGQFKQKSPLTKSPDNIKKGLPLLQKLSTSHRFYSRPHNAQLYNKTIKTIQRRVISPSDKHQFESTYRNSFYGGDVVQAIKHKKKLIRQTVSKLGISG